MRYCPECTIQTPLITYETKGVRGERCIPCQKMWILETTFARAIQDQEIFLKEIGKSKFKCPDCKGQFYRYEVNKTKPFIIEKCNECDSVWMPVGAVNAYMELEPVGDVHIETETLNDTPSWNTYISNHLLRIPEIEESERDFKNVIEKKNSNLSFVFFIAMTLAIGVSAERFGFTNADPFRMAGVTILTHSFLHANIYHYLSNMLFYLMFAYRVEGRIGSEGFIALFTISSVFAVLFQVLFSNGTFMMVGASGVIMGIMMYYSLAFPRTQVVKRSFDPSTWSWTTSRYSIYTMMLLNFISNSLSLPNTQSGIAYGAHVGGIVGGFLYYLLGQRPEFKRNDPKD